MRMWKIDPKLLCRQHLLGEHLEMHMFAGCLREGKSLAGYVRAHLVELDCIQSRHDELAKEMLRRGYKHLSPLKPFPCHKDGKVDVDSNIKELTERCTECRKRMHTYAIHAFKLY